MNNKQSAYQQLQSHFNKIGELENMWRSPKDEATMMPEGSGKLEAKSRYLIWGHTQVKMTQRSKNGSWIARAITLSTFETSKRL